MIDAPLWLDQDRSAQIRGTKRYLKLDWGHDGRLLVLTSDSTQGPWKPVWRDGLGGRI